VKHDEPTLIAFLEGELEPANAAAFDVHLMDCDACWAAVQEDRHGRLLVESLRETVSWSVRDRVRMSVELAAKRRDRPRRRRPWLALSAAALVAIGVLVGAATVGRPGSRDPEPVAAVVRLARAGGAGAPTELLTAGGQHIAVARYRLGDHDVVVAQSSRPFPMPAHAHPLSRAGESPWATSRAELRLLCFSGDHPALLAGDVPLRDLEAMAHSLGIS
jgi:anti-sigma factor RsiW